MTEAYWSMRREQTECIFFVLIVYRILNKDKMIHYAYTMGAFQLFTHLNTTYTGTHKVHDSIGIECAWLRSVSNRVRLNVAFSCIK